MRAFFFNIWAFIDPIYIYLCNIKHLRNENKKHNIIRVRLTKYKGREVVLSCGQTIKKNDLLIKIHLYNTELLKEMFSIKNDVRKALLIHKHMEESMPSLATYIKQHEKYDDIKGIIGITMINRGYRKLGFESFSMKSRLYRWFKTLRLFPISLLFVTEPATSFKKKHGINYLFMSKQKIMDQYLN